MDMILQSLLESFKEFKLNYNMNKKIYSFSKLMNELVATEGILGTSSVDADGTSVREHCLKMISNLNTLEVLGADIDRES